MAWTATSAATGNRWRADVRLKLCQQLQTRRSCCQNCQAKFQSISRILFTGGAAARRPCRSIDPPETAGGGDDSAQEDSSSKAPPSMTRVCAEESSFDSNLGSVLRCLAAVMHDGPHPPKPFSIFVQRQVGAQAIRGVGRYDYN